MNNFPPPIGDAPRIEYLPCCGLMLDHSYQRMIEGSASRRLIKNIAENWDWRLCAPLTISQRGSHDDNEWQDGDGYYVIDGQHRLRAAELRGDIEELPCIITKFGSYEDEARLFVAVNSSRRQISPLDRFHARVAAKEEKALAIKSAVEEATLKISRYPDAEFWKPMEIAFPDAVGAWIEKYGRAAVVNALEIVVICYPSVVLKQGQKIVDGILYFLEHSILDDEKYFAFIDLIKSKRQLQWIIERDKLRANEELAFQDQALAEVWARQLGVKMGKVLGRGQRRFETKKPGNGLTLQPEHVVVEEGRTLFPSTVQHPSTTVERILKSGHNSSKIGSKVEKGEWAGFPIFTLTLEERKTCPDTCKQLLSCYGNNMHHAHRWQHGPHLEERLWAELEELNATHEGFVVRLHVLGDFYDLGYVKYWQKALDEFTGLRVWGYTAHNPDSKIGEELLGMAVSQWERFAIRFSGSDMQEMTATVIDTDDDCAENAFICPAQKMQTACCATCGLCWTTEKNVAFLKH